MKTKTDTRPIHQPRARHPQAAPRPADTGTTPHRPYTDFLTLAFYPGMCPEEPRPARANAA